MKEWIYGRNPVIETILAGRRQVFRLRVARESKNHPRLDRLIEYAASRKIPIEPVPREQIDPLTDHHQGVAVQVSSYPYSSLANILSVADNRGDPPLVLLLDTLQDPQNLGTLLRTAEIVGVQGILLPKRHSASVTPAVVNASSGASEHLLIAQTNIAQAIDILKRNGLWVIGLETGSQAQSPDELNLDGPLGLVIGSEGKGMRPLVRRSCDMLMRLPMRGKIDSLNAAVAGSIALYLVWQARGYGGADEAKETIDEPGKS